MAVRKRRWPVTNERRNSQRLPLAIPLFLRGVEQGGREFLDFTVAFNVSAGGALVASRRSIPQSTRISLEIPSAPWFRLKVPTDSVRSLKARVVRVTKQGPYNLCAVRFARPLV